METAIIRTLVLGVCSVLFHNIKARKCTPATFPRAFAGTVSTVSLYGALFGLVETAVQYFGSSYQVNPFVLLFGIATIALMKVVRAPWNPFIQTVRSVTVITFPVFVVGYPLYALTVAETWNANLAYILIIGFMFEFGNRYIYNRVWIPALNDWISF